MGNDVVKLSIADDGWCDAALARVNDGQETAISITGPAVLTVIRRMHGAVARLPLLDLWKGVSAVIPQAGVIKVDPAIVVPVLAAIGGVSAAVGLAAFVGTVAVAHGMQVSFEYRPSDLLDPTDDEFLIHLLPKS